MKTTYSLFTGIALIFASACQQPAHKLSQLNPKTEAYRQEMARQISAHPNQFKYILDGYHAQDGKEYLSVNITGDGITTKADVFVANWDKMTGIKRTQGIGYCGAELKGLVLGANGSDLFYKDLQAVVD